MLRPRAAQEALPGEVGSRMAGRQPTEGQRSHAFPPGARRRKPAGAGARAFACDNFTGVTRLETRIGQALRRWVERTSQRPRAVAGVLGGVTLCLGVYAAMHLGVNTDY